MGKLSKIEILEYALDGLFLESEHGYHVGDKIEEIKTLISREELINKLMEEKYRVKKD